nr:zinc transporter ZIP11 isoform X7 [Pan paniscus]
MLQGHSSVFQALLGTFFTWGMTAAGAALVFVFSSGQRRILDGSLGFAAGVMLAASYWSLLAPAVEMATSSGGFGAFAFFPVAVGFTLGAAFVYLADLLMPHLGAAEDPQTALALNFGSTLLKKKSDPEGPALLFPESELSIRIDKSENGEAYQRKKAAATGLPEGPAVPVPSRGNLAQPGGSSWRRIALLILAITIHNVPESHLFITKFKDLRLFALYRFPFSCKKQHCIFQSTRKFCGQSRKTKHSTSVARSGANAALMILDVSALSY